MKRMLMACALLMAFAGAAIAAGGPAQLNVGCGLGTLLWENKADGSLLFQLFQGTTNGTFGSQTFGMTTGTSECKQPAKVVKNDRAVEFVRANLDDLARDIATGRGESLDTLAELLAVPAPQREAFGKTLKAHFAEIFPSSGVEYAHVIDTIVLVSSRG